MLGSVATKPIDYQPPTGPGVQDYIIVGGVVVILALVYLIISNILKTKPNKPKKSTHTLNGEYVKRFSFTRILAGILIILGVLVLSYPSMAQYFSELASQQMINKHKQTEESEPAQIKKVLDSAVAYNRGLPGSALDTNMDIAQPGSAPYKLYLKQLSFSEGVSELGDIDIPKLNAKIPIFHGTSQSVLSQGAGHMFGTALPVGGQGIRPVITGHSGLAEKTLFTDLNKMKQGDTFDLDVAGQKMRYRVTDIKTILPDDSDALLPVPGKDLVTLLTCTPIGINSHRLIVTGERVDMPQAGYIPVKREVPFPWWMFVVGGGSICGLCLIFSRRKVRVEK